MTQLRAPRLRVLADGVVLPGALDAEVTGTNHFGADHFRARLAISADPNGLAAWDARNAALIEIQIGLDASSWSSLITGQIDSLRADTVAGVLEIEGRDLSARLIEARTREAFANQTASDIATLLAGRHGLTAQVSLTSTPVGRYYSADHQRVTLDRLARASTEWDLLVWLAQQEGYDVFVVATTLYFQPSDAAAAPSLLLQAAAGSPVPANITALHLHRAMTLAGNVEVTVKSWNSQSQTAFTQTAQRASGAGPMRSYVYVHPNLTPDGALQLAQQKLAAITGHEYTITATMPGELALQPRQVVTLAGTASAFDQTYVVDEICRRLSARTGFVQTLRARTGGSA